MRTRLSRATRALLLLPLLAAGPAGTRAPSADPAPSTLSLRVYADAARRDLVMEVGPVDLPADGEHHQLPAFHGRIPVDGWMHGFRVDLVDAAGRPVPRIALHHVNVITPGQRELFSQIMLRVAAAGQETDPVALPRMVGYRVHRGQEMIVTSMLHNPTGRAYRGVRIRVHFPYTPADARLKPVSVLPFYIDVMPPASLHSYDLPPGRSSRTWEARPAVAARILGMGGHIHQFGTLLRMEDVTAKRVIWEARPQVDRTGQIVGVPQTLFIWRLGIPVYPDHLYRVTAEYNNTSGETIPGGAMGTLGGAVIPDDASKWPAIDPNNPELRLDWHLVHTGNPGGHGHGGHGQMHMHVPAAAPAPKAGTVAAAPHAHTQVAASGQHAMAMPHAAGQRR
jgi:hypothetical protein